MNVKNAPQQCIPFGLQYHKNLIIKPRNTSMDIVDFGKWRMQIIFIRSVQNLHQCIPFGLQYHKNLIIKARNTSMDIVDFGKWRMQIILIRSVQNLHQCTSSLVTLLLPVQLSAWVVFLEVRWYFLDVLGLLNPQMYEASMI